MAKYTTYGKAQNGLHKVGNKMFTLDFADFPYFKRLMIERMKRSIWFDGGKIGATATQLYGNKQAIIDLVKRTVEEMDEATIEVFKTLEKGYDADEMKQRKYLLDSVK